MLNASQNGEKFDVSTSPIPSPSWSCIPLNPISLESFVFHLVRDGKYFEKPLQKIQTGTSFQVWLFNKSLFWGQLRIRVPFFVQPRQRSITRLGLSTLRMPRFEISILQGLGRKMMIGGKRIVRVFGELTVRRWGKNVLVVLGIRLISSFECPPSRAITWWQSLCFCLFLAACTFVVSPNPDKGISSTNETFFTVIDKPVV